MTDPKRVLLVCTSTPEYHDTGYRTGLWLGELTHFYDAVEQAGHTQVVASIAGGRVPIDPESLGHAVLALGGTGKRYEDRAFMDLLVDTPSITTLAADDFDAIYLTGGHGTMYDFPDDELAGLVSGFAAQGKVVAAVCHGPAGLLNARLEGRPLVEGRKVTGFSWPEEKLAGRAGAVPFRLDEALRLKGGQYTKALRPMVEKVVVDGRLVTGQNPMSAEGVAKAVLKLLAKG